MTSENAFDHLASDYDETFTHTPIGRYLRGRVHRRLARLFRAGDRVLELGCGTGEDALWLAGRGVSILATDASQAMLDITQAKVAGSPLVRVARLDLRLLPLPPPSNPLPVYAKGRNVLPLLTGEAGRGFDGVFANFGPLNGLDDWRPLAAWLAARVKPGGAVAFAVMSPLCMWEMIWHGAHGDLKTALRRWRRDTRFQPLPPSPYTEKGNGGEKESGSKAMLVRYPTIRRLTRDFAPHFRRIHIEPLGLFLPPSDVFGAVEKRPRLFKMLMRLEERFGRWGHLALLADHYWIEFRRV
ncbi:MAG: class I SAM-dependent methyltransferase [Chloroflexi bacterium]|nr:class I SAM-dependent methyltransferase [Chloroflexota bacterium]